MHGDAMAGKRVPRPPGTMRTSSGDAGGEANVCVGRIDWANGAGLVVVDEGTRVETGSRDSAMR